MRISLFSDEYSQEPDLFFPFFKEHGVKNIELRCVRGKRLPFLDKETKKTLKEGIEKNALKVSALSPGTFKGDDPEGTRMEDAISSVLTKTLDMAHELGAGNILVFAPNRPKGPPPEDPIPNWLIEGFRKCASLAESRGCLLCLENEPGSWADTSKETSRLLKAIGHENLKLNWDPANALFSGEKEVWPHAQTRLLPWIAHVHIKDTVSGGPKFLPLGKGAVPWRKILSDLEKNAYKGFLTVETHCEPLLETTPSALMELKSLLSLLNT